MIVDSLNRWRRYAGCSPHFEKAFGFLDAFSGDLPSGRHEIDGDNAFALVQRYTSIAPGAHPFEAHRRYIDVQYLHLGQELLWWAPIETLGAAAQPYDDRKEAALFGPIAQPTVVRMVPGRFAVMFPEDGHAPCLIWDAPSEIVKVVIKVRV